MATGDILLICPAARHGQLIQAAPADVESRDDADPLATVGGLYGTVGKLYMYVKFDNGSAVAAVRGQACYVNSLATWDPANGLATVTSDVSGAVGVDANAIVAGVFTYAATDGQYTFIQVGGVMANALHNANAAGDRLIAGATDGSLVDSSGSAAVTEYVAIALEAAS